MYEINDPDRMTIAVKTDAGSRFEFVKVTTGTLGSRPAETRASWSNTSF